MKKSFRGNVTRKIKKIINNKNYFYIFIFFFVIFLMSQGKNKMKIIKNILKSMP